MKKARHSTESLIGVSVLGVLVLVAGGVLLQQARFDISLFTPILSTDSPLPSSSFPEGSSLFVPLPQGLVPMSPAETFTPETLSEKINGKAELYLSGGFHLLQCRRFMEKDKPESWLELFLYDMGTMRNAFAVFTAQRRVDGRKIDLTPFAYGTANALFFVHGRHYIEIVSAAENAPPVMTTLAEELVRQNPSQGERIIELALFPSEHLVEGSWVLLSENVFGFEHMDQTFTAEYDLPEGRYTAFLSLRKDPGEARRLVDGYVRFLLANGGTAIDCTGGPPDLHCIEILDTFEVIFSVGRAVAGVHQAENPASASKLARSFYETITGRLP
ncbi:MAG: hypothetical protein KBH99_11475 [Syntrophobacteraceae bacterium]|nr:hypothetical protein [Syntrophobacteraceae bacterium]